MATPLAASQPAFHVPAEEEPHLRTFMQWPVSRRVHPDRIFREMVQGTIADIANTIADFEPVVMLMDRKHEPAARRMLSDAVEIWDIPTEDLWARDSGPLFANGPDGPVVMSLNFNGWGNKQVHRNDGQIAARVAERLGLPLIDSGVVGEPGGVESDGHGLLMAHESSWVINNRNPGLSRAEITERLKKAYGADHMIWAPGVAGADITDYHIDSLARFTARARVLIQMPDYDDPNDPWNRAAQETHAVLRDTGLALDTIPEPEDIRVQSDDFVASYVNYYVCNDAVICAEFGDRRADAIAVDTLAELYPGREVIALNVDPLGEMGGGIHCATQQQPRF